MRSRSGPDQVDGEAAEVLRCRTTTSAVGQDETGTVTAELAVALPLAVFVAALLLSAVSMGVDQIRCVNAARAGSRELARGEDLEVAKRAATTAAPRGARVSLGSAADLVSVTVAVRPPPLLSWMGVSVGPHAEASARPESVPP